MTKNGVCYNLSLTPYLVDLDNVLFFFSSEFYMNKFLSVIECTRSNINSKFTSIYGFVIHSDLISDVYLYARTEKRGFRILYKGEVFTCLQSLELDGLTIKKKP